MDDRVNSLNRIGNDDENITPMNLTNKVKTAINKNLDINNTKQSIINLNQPKIRQTLDEIVDKNKDEKLKKLNKQGTRELNDMTRNIRRAANDANRGTVTKGLAYLPRLIEDGVRKTRRGIENVGDYTGVNSLGSRTANYLGSISSNLVTKKNNSGTQKNKVGSTGPGKKITITFIQDDQNQCFIKDYNLCNVDNVQTELIDVYDDKLIIDGNNKPVKKNIQNIGKNQQTTYGCNGPVSFKGEGDGSENDLMGKGDGSENKDNGDGSENKDNGDGSENKDNGDGSENDEIERREKENENALAAYNSRIDDIVKVDKQLEQARREDKQREDKQREQAEQEQAKRKQGQWMTQWMQGKSNTGNKIQGGYNSSKSITRRKNAKPMSKRLLRYSRRSSTYKKF